MLDKVWFLSTVASNESQNSDNFNVSPLKEGISNFGKFTDPWRSPCVPDPSCLSCWSVVRCCSCVWSWTTCSSRNGSTHFLFGTTRACTDFLRHSSSLTQLNTSVMILISRLNDNSAHAASILSESGLIFLMLFSISSTKLSRSIDPVWTARRFFPVVRYCWSIFL